MTSKWALIGIVLSTIYTPSVRAEQVVTVVTYTGTYQSRYAKAVIEPFMAENADIKIVHYPVMNSAQMLGLLRAQKTDPQFDVVILDVSVAKAATDEGLFVRMDEASFPVLKDLRAEARVPEVAGAGHTLDNLVMVYNADQFPQPPKTWMEMTSPRNNKRVAMLGLPDIQSLGLLMVLDRAGGGSDLSLDKGMSALREIAPNVLTWDPKPEIFQAIASGQVWLGTAWNARAQVNIDLSKGKIQATVPEEGSVLQMDTINLVTNGPSKDGAARFVSYALGPVAQKAFAEAMFYTPTNAKVQLSEAAKARGGSGANVKVVPVNWLAVAGVRDTVTERWRRTVIPLSR